MLIGKFLKVHGLKGELKTESYFDSPDSLLSVKKVTVKNTVYEVEKTRMNGGFVLVKLKNIDSATAAEPLAQQQVFAEKEDMPAIPEGRYYIADLIGCQVFADGEKVGRVKDILQHGAADVFVTVNEGKTVLFPWVDGVIQSVDTDVRLITVDKKRFNEVAVYED